MHAVIDLERTALEIHLIVQGRRRIVVVIVVLMGGDNKLVFLGFEYRCTEEVRITAIRLFLYYRYFDLLVLDILATNRLLAIIIHRHTVL